MTRIVFEDMNTIIFIFLQVTKAFDKLYSLLMRRFIFTQTFCQYVYA